MITHLDLFSGIGGFALSARWAGIETIQFVEKDKFCQKVLNKNFVGVPVFDDIKKFSYKEGSINLITGGFPCQPFSIAGQKRGTNDDRYLWPEFLRVIKEVKPDWIIAENVTGIVGMVLESILIDLEKENYEVGTYIIPACAANAPHRRERVWVIAHNNSQRYDNGVGVWKERCIQDDKEQHYTKIQRKWEQLKPKSWATFDAKNWLGIITNPHGLTRKQDNQSSFAKLSSGNSRMGHTEPYRGTTTIVEREENKPPIPGVDDGLPYLVDRNRALGNAIVPQVIYPVMQFIQESYGQN